MRKLLALTLTIVVAAGLTLGVTASNAAITDGSDARVTTDRTDYQPGGTVIITGSGFLPGETVSLVIKENPANHPDTNLSAVADEQGNFTNSAFSPTEEHLGTTFTLTATGLASGRTDDTTFTDGTPYSYSPSEPMLTIQAGQSGSYTQSVIAPRVNVGNVQVGLQVSAPASNSAAGWVVGPSGSIQVNTNAASESNRTASWLVNVNVPAGTAPGNYTAILKGTVPAGNTALEQGPGATLTVKVIPATPTDTAPPVSSASAISGGNPYNGVNFTNQNVTVTLSATDFPNPGGSGVANTFYTLSTDALGYRTSPNPFTISNEGVTTVTFYSVDNAGNSEAVAPSAAKTFNVKIDKTKPVITLNGSNPITISYGTAFVDPGAAASDAGGSGLAGAVSASGSVNTNVVGDYTISYDVSDNAGNAADTVTRTVHVVKADQTIDFGALADKTYGDPDFDVSATSGSGGAVTFTAAGNCTVAGTSVHLTGAGSCTITAHQAGNDNYNAAPDVPQSFNIGKANATINVTPYSVTYDGQPHTATGTASGVGGENLNSLLDLSGTTHTNAGTYGTDAWSFAGNGNYHAANGTVSDSIAKADATISVSGTTVTYDGNPHGATGTATGVQGESLGGLNLGASFTNVPGGTANWTFTDATGNYNGKSGSVEIVINKATANIIVNGYTGTYDGAAHGASGSATGVKGESLSGLDLGSSFTNVPGGSASWTFTDVTGNYNNANGTADIVINKADATINVSGTTVTYDGDPHGATGTATGVGGVDLGSGLNLGASFTNVPGGTAHWTFDGGTNYNNANGSVEIAISKANATLNVVGFTGTYDGLPHGATGTATGVKGEDLTNLLSLGDSFTNVPGGTPAWSFAGNGNYNSAANSVAIIINKAPSVTAVSCTGPNTYTGLPLTPCSVSVTGAGGLNLTPAPAYSNNVNAGIATASYTFAGDNNHDGSDDSQTFTIGKAGATINVTGYTGVFDGAAHGATGSATGVQGESLAGLNLGASFTNVPGGTANWTFSDVTGNYNDASGSVEIAISKADAVINVSGYTGTYDGAAHGASGSAAGVGGVDLSGSLNLGASFTDVPGGTANWSFSGGTNYNDKSGSVEIVINKATASINITPYSGVYDGNAHGISGTATGVGGADLSAGLNLGASFTDVPGGTATWAFSGGTNYKNDTGTAAVTITKADATISVTPYSVTYDGQPHTATGTASGVKSEDLGSQLNLSGTTHTGAGTYNGDQWTFSGGTNYNDASGTVDNAIAKAGATINVNGYTGTYDGAAHGASGSATGAGGENLNGLLNLGASFTNAPGGTANWTFDGDANHNPASGTASIVINQKALTITASSPSDITYGDAAPSVTPSYNGFIPGEGPANLSAAPNCGTGYAAGSNAGGYATTCSGAAAVNYSIGYVDGSFNVNKKSLTVKAEDKSKVFDGTPFTAFTVTYTGFVLGQNQSALGGTLGFNTNPAGATAVGTYTITPGGLTSNNYVITFGTGTLTIGSWTLKGFYQPVDMSVAGVVWNTIKGGSTVPLKFNIFAGTTEKTDTASIKGFAVNSVSCTVGFEDPVDLAFTTTGGTALRYDAAAGQFIQNWQTPKQGGQCLKVTMMAQDGSTISAFFKTK